MRIAQATFGIRNHPFTRHLDDAEKT